MKTEKLRKREKTLKKLKLHLKFLHTKDLIVSLNEFDTHGTSFHSKTEKKTIKICQRRGEPITKKYTFYESK